MSAERCPICDQAVADEFRPFCSRRCRDVDLNRWLSGTYRVETDEEPDPGEPIPVDPEDSRPW